MGRSYDEEYVEFADAALPRLTRTAYLVCADRHRADEAAQQALIKLYLAWPRVQRRDGLMPYARRTVLRSLIDEARRPWRRELADSDLLETLDQPQPDNFGRIDERVELVRALQRISARRRACIVLRYFDDLSVEETAGVLGCSVGTVKSQTARGLRDLRVALESVGVTRIRIGKEVLAT
jgi:RNA polymerase sigma-70 factor (sigma-E family)